MYPLMVYPEWLYDVNNIACTELKTHEGKDRVHNNLLSSCELQANPGSVPQSDSAVISCSPHIADKAANCCPGVLADGCTVRPDNIKTDVQFDGLTDIHADGMTDVPADGLTDVPADGLTEVPADKLIDVNANGLTDIPPEELTDVPADGLTDVPADELTAVYADGLTDIPPEELTDVHADELTDVYAEGLTYISANGLTNVPAYWLTDGPSDELTAVPADDMTDVPADDMTDVPADGLTDVQINVLTDGYIRITSFGTEVIKSNNTKLLNLEPSLRNEKSATVTSESVKKLANKTQETDNDERSPRNKVFCEIGTNDLNFGNVLPTSHRLEDKLSNFAQCTGNASSRKSSSNNHWNSTKLDIHAAIDGLKAEHNSYVQEDNLNIEEVAGLDICLSDIDILGPLNSVANAEKDVLSLHVRECDGGTNGGMDLGGNNSIVVIKQAGSLPISDSNSYRNLCQETPSNPESDLKFDPQRHILWRHTLVAYPLTQSSLHIATESAVLQNNVYCFMKFEVFRICSFNILEFPADLDARVSSLAKNGYYYSRPEVVCFACGAKSTEFIVSFLENFHRPECSRDVLNVPISQLIHGLNLEELTDFYIRYNSLTPFLSEHIEHPASGFEMADNAVPSGRYAELKHSGSRNSSSSGYSSVASSPGNLEKDCNANAENDSFHLGKGDLSKVAKGVSSQHLNVDNLHRLRPNQKGASSHNINVESQEEHRPCQILTSIARHPVNVNERGLSHQAVAWSENVAEREATGHVDSSLDLSNAAFPSYARRAVRMQTFQTWDQEHTHRPDELVENGFFYTGQDHRVQCFYCGMELLFSNPTDIPAYQHSKYQPNCLFIRMHKGQEYIDHVQRDILHEQGASSAATNTNISSQPEPETTSATTEGRTQQDYLTSEAAQEAVRSRWPIDKVQNAVKYIVKEFGESCLETELLFDVLRNFDGTDSPNESLINELPTSDSESEIGDMTGPALLEPVQSSSINVITEAVRADGEHEPEKESLLAGAAEVQRPAASKLNFSEILQSVQREHTLLVERTTCRVCLSKPICSIYLPCGHVMACQECADAASYCLLCQKQIVGTANVYLA